MSWYSDLVSAIAGESQLLGLIGTADRIMSGRLSEKLPYYPPLILIDVQQDGPFVEGEEGIIADCWECVIGILAEGSTEEIRSRVVALLEGRGFKGGGSKRIVVGRPEWSGLEMTFSGLRMRR